LAASVGNLVSNIERFVTDLYDNLPRIVREMMTEISDLVLQRLKRSARPMLRDRRTTMSLFEANLSQVWGKAIDLLEMHLAMSIEAGESFNAEFRPSASSNNDHVFEVLSRLHARACQVASEVITLLKAGHADGAHARWRSLHEISVVSSFIAKHGNDLAERYLLHEGIESYRAAQQYQDCCQRLGYEPMTVKEFSNICSRRQSLIEQFGKSYDNDYGWASGAVGKERPTFSDIEKAVGLDHLRPYYRMASYNVHANPKGVFFKLGLYPGTEDILLAGPSNVGLIDPGHATALSLGQVTVTLLITRPNLGRLVVCDILIKLGDEIGEKFWLADRKLQTDANDSVIHTDQAQSPKN